MVTLRIKDAPFAGDPDNADDFYTALGKFIIVWGRFEMHVSTTLLNIRAFREFSGWQA
jgi:hypothetical protein